MTSILGQHKLSKLIELAKKTPDGLIIECGVYNGGALKELALQFPDRDCFGFDTFEGMPDKFYNETEGHPPGDFKTSLNDVLETMKGVPNVSLIPGLVPDTLESINPRDISFAHLDMDHGESTRLALEFLWDHMVSGGIILFDDYDWHACQNIKPVVDGFAAKHGLTVHKLSEHQAYLVKPWGVP